MGVVTVSSSASRTPLGLSATFSSYRSPSKRPLILAFKTGKAKSKALVAPTELVSIPAETPKDNKKKLRRSRKSSERLKALSTDEASPCTLEVDYSEAAAKLENLYKLSPTIDTPDVERTDHIVKRGRRRMEKNGEVGDRAEYKIGSNVVRSGRKMPIRMSLSKRIALRNTIDREMFSSAPRRKNAKTEEDRIHKLIREYSMLSEVGSYDWKKMKIPPVLPSSEHSFLFNLMQPMKEILEVKGNLEQDLGREPREDELTEAINMTVVQLREKLVVGLAARNKLIKVRVEIQRAKLELSFELHRSPTEEEIAKKVGISLARYNEVMRASKPVSSLHAKNRTTQAELIDELVDYEGVGGDDGQQPALLRLALDNVLDSLKPKENLVIRQRYGLDGKGNRTLGEIAGNLNISREMVRKHEMKAMMKLKHPTRVDYLRTHVF